MGAAGQVAALPGRAEAPLRTRATASSRELVALLLLSCALVGLALWTGDRVGWEGDDLAVMFGIGHLDMVGREGVYRYAWQPWTYEALNLLRDAGVRFLDAAFCANVAGMLGVALLIVLMRMSLGSRVPHALGLAVLLGLSIPELWITSFYFNSTALALPFFVASLVCAQQAQGDEQDLRSVSASGAFFGVSCLFRMDFSLAALFLFVMVDVKPGRRHVAWSLAALSMPLAFAVAHPQWLGQLAGVVNRFEAGQAPWGAGNSIKVLLLTLGPAILVLPVLLIRRAGQRDGLRELFYSRALQLVCLLPMLAPLKNLYSGKYLVPFLCCLLWLAAREIARADRRQPLRFDAAWRPRIGIATGVLIASLLTTLVPAKHAWFMTHDGVRSFGAYRHLLVKLDSATDRPPHLRAPLQLARAIDACFGDTLVVLPAPNGNLLSNVWNFGWTSLHLSSMGWRLERYEPLHEIRMSRPDRGQGVRFISAQRLIASEEVRGLRVIDLRRALSAGTQDVSLDVLAALPSLGAAACPSH